MSGNADRSLTYRIQLASNRTKQWYKLQLEEEKRIHQDNVQRPILADPSEELPLYERMGSLAVYRDGVLYLNSPELGIIETPIPVPPTPESIWWVSNFVTDPTGIQILGGLNLGILSTNETNSNYTIRYYTYDAVTTTNVYNRDGTLVKNLSSAFLDVFYETSLIFTSNDGKTMKLYQFQNANNNFSLLSTVNFTRASITPRIATGLNRVYSVIGYANIASNQGPYGQKLRILDISDNIVADITSDVSGTSTSRFDSALMIYSTSGDYITNASMRTRDLSDNITNNIAVRGINTFSDGSVIVAGDFNTQQVVFYNAADVSMGQITLPMRKTNGGANNRDIFMAAFRTDGTLRYYNYIRSTNIGAISANELSTHIEVDSADNYYIIGTIANPSFPNLVQIFDVSKSSVTPSANIVYDTSGSAPGGAPTNNLNTDVPIGFVAKYDFNGNFQWFAPTFMTLPDISGDASYLGRAVGNDIVISSFFLRGTGAGIPLFIINGQTSAQRGTPYTSFTNLQLVNSSLINNFIVKYNGTNGQVQWVKHIRADCNLSVSANGSSLPLVVDSLNNIYSVCSVYSSTAQIWDISGIPPVGTQLGATINTASGSTPIITSFSSAGALNWYAVLNRNSGAPGTYAYWSRATTNNELLVLFRSTSQSTLEIYNSAGVQISSTSIDFLANGPNRILLLKISSDGNTVSYIKSIMPTTPIDFGGSNVSVNNGISIDSSNNVYITGELQIQGAPPAIGQSFDFVNQDDAIVGTMTKLSANNFEYFTVKIPASFTQE
jgi:hypothetical protein